MISASGPRLRLLSHAFAVVERFHDIHAGNSAVRFDLSFCALWPAQTVVHLSILHAATPYVSHSSNLESSLIFRNRETADDAGTQSTLV